MTLTLMTLRIEYVRCVITYDEGSVACFVIQKWPEAR